MIFKKKEIPNCRLCQNKTDDKSMVGIMTQGKLCSAIGYKQCSEVHNSKLCKKLYRKIKQKNEVTNEI